MVKRKRVCKDFFKPSLTKQSFRDSCDVNHMVRKYRDTIGVDFLNQYSGEVPGNFGDFSDVPDYLTALNLVQQADEAFSSLPASVRKRFSNDPVEFLEFMHDPSNLDEMVSLGLATKRPGEPKKEVDGQ